MSAFLAAQGHDRISLRLAAGLALAGGILFMMTGLLGLLHGQSFSQTFFELGPANDDTMGVILGIGIPYVSALYIIWILFLRLAKRRQRL